MAYKFQLGDAQLSGALRQEGTIVAEDKLTVDSGGAEITGAVDISSTLDVAGATALASTLDVTGKSTLDVLEVNGQANFDERTVIGNGTGNAGDIVNIRAKFINGLTPRDDQQYDLGTGTLKWKELFVATASVDIVDASQISGALEHPLSAAAGAGISTFVYDNQTPGVTVAVSGAAQLNSDEVIKWDDSQGAFVKTIMSDNGSQVTVAGALSGSGQLQIGNGAQIRNGLEIKSTGMQVTGAAEFQDSLTVNGDVTLGNAPTDVVEFQADISSSLLASQDSAFDIGADLERWRNIYGDTIIAAQLSGALKNQITAQEGVTMTAFNNSTNSVIELSGASAFASDGRVLYWDDTNQKFVNTDARHTAGALIVDSALSASGQLDIDGISNLDGAVVMGASATVGTTLGVTGKTTLSGELQVDDVSVFNSPVTLGSAIQDHIDFVGEVSSSIIPSGSGQFDLGANGNEWENIYVNNIIGADIKLDVVTGVAFGTGTDVLLANGSANLPACSDGKVIRVKNISAGAIALTASGGNFIEDGSSTTIELETRGAAVTLIGSGSNWFIF